MLITRIWISGTHTQSRTSARAEAVGLPRRATVAGPVLRPLPSAPEDRELVAQDHDLELPLTAAACEHADEAAEEPVQQTRQHDAQSEPTRPRSPAQPSPGESNFFTPQGAVPQGGGDPEFLRGKERLEFDSEDAGGRAAVPSRPTKRRESPPP
jgi:hypothetical protein